MNSLTKEAAAPTTDTAAPTTDLPHDTVHQNALQAEISVCRIESGPLLCERNLTLDQVLDEIRTGCHKDKICTLRALVEKHGYKSQEVKDAKRKLPAYLLSGRIDVGGKITAAFKGGRLTHSGVAQLDFDGIEDPKTIRDQIAKDPHCLAAWVSPSGTGVKGLCVIGPVSDESEHKTACGAVKRHFQDLYGLENDKSVSNSNRICYAGWDPDLQVNPAAVPLPQGEAPEAPAAAPGETEHLRQALSFIPTRPDRPLWIEIASSAFAYCGEDAISVLQGWSPEEDPGEYTQLFKNRLTKIGRGLLFDLAEKHGFDSSAMTREAFSVEAEEIEAERKANKKEERKAQQKLDALLERAYALAFDPLRPPPPDPVCLTLGKDYPVAARGDLTVVQGQSKSGKSAIVGAILGAAMKAELPPGQDLFGTPGDCLGFQWVDDKRGAIIHFDTEQSPSDFHAVGTRSIKRSGGDSVSSRLASIPLVLFTKEERLLLLNGIMAKEKARHDGVDLVILDGVADFCRAVNDPAEAPDLVTTLHRLAHTFNCAIVCVLHENPSSQATVEGKTRGHLGSELNRKAFGNLRCDKTGGVSVMWGNQMRKREIPKEDGFCFAWSDNAEMHVAQGRRRSLAKNAKKEKRNAEENAFFTEILGEIHGAKEGQNGFVPTLTVLTAFDAHRDNGGTMKKDALRKRIERAEKAEVLEKVGVGMWTLAEKGQEGQSRDN